MLGEITQEDEAMIEKEATTIEKDERVEKKERLTSISTTPMVSVMVAGKSEENDIMQRM